MCMCFFPFVPQTIEFDESAGAVLRIQPLRTPRDENIYECVAQNPHGEVTVHAKLTVLRGKEHFCLPVSVSREKVPVRLSLPSHGWEDCHKMHGQSAESFFGLFRPIRSACFHYLNFYYRKWLCKKQKQSACYYQTTYEFCQEGVLRVLAT